MPFLYQFIAAMAIAAPTILAQEYIERASGALTKLETITEIDKWEQTKYYTVKRFYIDKTNIGVHSSFDVSGRYSRDFNMHLYVVMPILVSEADTTSSSCSAWLGIEYSKRISNSLDDKEKEEEYLAFANESQKDLDKKDVSQFICLERVGNTDDGDGFKEAVLSSPKYISNYSPIFLAVNEPYENRNEDTFAWIFGTFGIGAGIWLIMLLIPKLDESVFNQYDGGRPSNDTDIKELIDFLKPSEGYFITPIIIYLNILIFIIMVFAGLGFNSFRGQDLLALGANYRPSFVDGEWWRLFTSVFLHGGLMHLGANMYGLLFVGIFLEPLLGRKKYLTSYLLTGVLASCTSLWWYDATVSVGASGAIFGLYGLFLALLLTKRFPPDFGNAFLASTLIFIGYNLLMGLNGGIDNAAHVGGLLSGFVVGLILYPKLKNQVESEPIE